MILMDMRLKTLIICFQHEMKRMPVTKQAKSILGIENVQMIGELKILLPKPLKRKCKTKLFWIELTKI